MNSYLNITVRVLTKQAIAMLGAIESRIRGVSATAAKANMGEAAFARGSASIRKFGNSLQWAGYQLMHAFTLPLALAGGAALKYELANEKAMAGVQKVYGDTALKVKIGTAGMNREVAALGKQFRVLSDIYGTSQTDVINIAEAWAAAGVSGRALGTAVESTLKTMVIGDLSSTAATKALISIQAQYGASTQDMTKILAALNVVENITGASMGDLITGFQRSASVAANAGVGYKQLASLLAALVPSAGTAAVAGNSLKTIFTNLLVPTEKARNAIKAMGIDIDATSWLHASAAKRLEMLSVKFKQLDGNQKVQASDYIANKYHISRFSQAMLDIGKSFDKNGKQIKGNSDALGYYGKSMNATKNDSDNFKVANNELQTVLKSNPQKLKQVWTVIKNDMAQTVAKLIPLIIQFVRGIADLVRWFTNLNPLVQKWIGVLILGLALLGPILLYLAAMAKLVHIVGSAFSFAGGIIKGFFRLFKTDVAAKTASDLEKISADGQAAMAKITEASETAVIQSSNVIRAAGLDLSEELIAAAQAQASAYEAELAAREVATETAFSAEATMATAAMGEVTLVTSEAFATMTTVEAAWFAASGRIWTAWQLLAGGSLVKVAGEVTLFETELAGLMRTLLGLAEIILRANGLLTDSYAIMSAEATAGITTVNTALTAQLALLGAISTQAVIAGSAIAGSAGAAGAVGAAGIAAGKAGKKAPMPGGGVNKMGGTKLIDDGANAAKAGEEGLVAGAGGAAAKTEGIFKRSILKIGGFFKSGFMTIARFVDRILMGIPSSIGRMLSSVGRMFSGVGRILSIAVEGIGSALGAVAAVMGIPVEALIAIILVVIATFLIFRHQITAIAKATWGAIVDMAQGIWVALKAVGGFFYDATAMVIHALEALPQAVVTIFKAVVNIIGDAAKDIYNLFSYINPFAHHSPSLVENVTKGMDLVAKKFAGIKSISAPMRAAYADIKTFGKAIAGLVQTQKDADKSANVKLLRKVDPGAVASYLKLDSDLNTLTADYTKLGTALARQQTLTDAYSDAVDKLQGKLDKENDTLTKLQSTQSKYSDLLNAAKDSVQTFASAGITGMKSFDDAIFANDQAQKKLQLQMLKMEDVLGPIDDAQSKLEALRGEIESLRGEQQGLRAGGAGSDILKSYDDQINALQNQTGATQDQIAQYDALQAQLDKLGQTAQELDLEKSLKFDPLTKQINDLATGMNELPFDTIMKGIRDSQKDVTTYTGKYNDATKAVDAQQKVVDKAQIAHDKMAKKLDTEQKKLDSVQKAYDKVGDSINSVKDAMDLMTDAANKAADAMDKTKGATATTSGLGASGGLKSAAGTSGLGRTGGLTEQTKGIDADTKKLMDGLDKSFGKLDLFGGLKKKIGGFFGGIKDDLSSVGGWIKKWIWDEPAKWGDWITEKTKDLGKLLWQWIVDGWNGVVDFFTGLPGMILDLVTSLPGLLFNAGKDLLGGLLYGLGYQLGLIVRFFENLPGWILNYFVNVTTWLLEAGKFLLEGLLKGIIIAAEGIGTFFKNLPGWILSFITSAPAWLLSTGHDILVGLKNGIVSGAEAVGDWFTNLPGYILGFVSDAGSWLADVGGDVISGLWHGVTKAASATWKFIKDMVNDFINGFKDALGIHSPSTVFMQMGKDIIQGLWNGIVFVWNTVVNFFRNVATIVVTAIGDLLKTLYNKGKDLISGFFTALGDGWTLVKNWLGNRASAVIGAIGDLLKTLYGKGRDLISGLKSGVVDKFKEVATWLGNRGSAAISAIGNLAKTLYNKGKDLLGGLKNGVIEKFDELGTWLRGLPSKLAGYFSKATTWLSSAGKDIASGLKTGLTTGLDTLKKVVGTPVYWAVKYAINPIITGINLLPGVKIPTISTKNIPHFAARGGIVPGGHNRDDVPVYTTPGELIVPKRVVSSFGGGNALMKALGFNGKIGGTHFAGGGTPFIPGPPDLGGYGSQVGGSQGSIKAAGGGAHTGVFDTFTHWVGKEVDKVTKLLRKGAAKAFMTAIGNPLKKADNVLDKMGEFGVRLDHGIDNKVDDVYTWIAGKEKKDVKKAEKDSINISGNHKALIDQALKYAGDPANIGTEGAVDTIVKFESGWNPNAINLTDSNAKAGHPSQGLMQTIPSTFEAYRLKSLSSDITNPLANLVAGIRYADSRYGGVMQVPGIVSLAHGGKYVGYDAGGLLPPGLNKVWNGTGKPEVIAPQTTFNEFVKSREEKAGGPTIIIQGNLEFPNVTNGSDAQDFLAHLEGLAT